MNSKSGAIPKKSQSGRRTRLVSSDSDGDFEYYNFARRNGFNTRLIRTQTRNPPLSPLFGDLSAVEMDNTNIATPKLIQDNDKKMDEFKERSMVEINKMIRKYDSEEFSKENTVKSAAEIGKAANLIAATINKKAKKFKENVVKSIQKPSEHRKYGSMNSVKLVTVENPVTALSSKNAIIASNIERTYENIKKIIDNIENLTTKQKALTRVQLPIKNKLSTRLPISVNNPTRTLSKPMGNQIANKPTTSAGATSTLTKKAPTTVSSTSIKGPYNRTVTTKKSTLVFTKGVSNPKSIITASVKPKIIPSTVQSSEIKQSASTASVAILECPVCFEQLLLDRPTVLTACGHMFCRRCMDVVQRNSTDLKCPLCRVPLTQVINIHV